MKDQEKMYFKRIICRKYLNLVKNLNYNFILFTEEHNAKYDLFHIYQFIPNLSSA